LSLLDDCDGVHSEYQEREGFGRMSKGTKELAGEIMSRKSYMGSRPLPLILILILIFFFG